MLAAVVARVLGLDARTVRRYVRLKVWSGRVVLCPSKKKRGGKPREHIYVHRSVLESMRDRGGDVQLF